MVEESSALLPPGEESAEAETGHIPEAELESGQPAPEPASEPAFVCDCEESMRSACEGLPFYKEHEGRRYCVLHYPGKEKSAEFKTVFDSKLENKDFNFRGVWFPDDVDLRRFEFSAYADFGSATFSAAAYFRSATFSAAADFSAATFGAYADFSRTTFSARANFISATFSAAASFSLATFSFAADFNSATFSAAASFSSATFSAAASFRSATFSADASFSSGTFSAYANFRSTTFTGDADFSSATFSAYADFNRTTFKAACTFDRTAFHARAFFTRASMFDSFQVLGSASDRQLKGMNLPARELGDHPALDLQRVRIEHPDRVAFHTLILRPHWFVNVDPREFVFTDVEWPRGRRSLKQEISALETKKVSSPNRLLTIACRQLAENAESNSRFEEASQFRYWAMDLARPTKWNGWALWKTDWLYMLYWAVSGYGEKILRALGILVAVWFVFVVLYTQVGFMQQLQATSVGASSAMPRSMTIEDTIGKPLEFSRALIYSFAVMSLQKPEPKPLTGAAQTLVLLETILGPVQAALLALAIRRKFMR